MSFDTVMNSLPTFCNEQISKAFVKAYWIINDPLYKKILCSISGGSDSDIMLDIIHRVDEQKKVQYVWFDTGLEYRATKNHLDYLEQRYGIKIMREKAVKPIPVCVREYGQSFVSKYVSQMISRLQGHGFKFEDRPYEELVVRYPRCVVALKWWCNKHKEDIEKHSPKNDNLSRFDIGRNKYLKEFMIANPPMFNVSDSCCDYAKKAVSKRLIKTTKGGYYGTYFTIRSGY